MSSHAITLIVLLCWVQLAWAAPADELTVLHQEVQQLTQTVRQLTTTVQAQQQRITELERAQGVADTRASTAAVTAQGAPVLSPALQRQRVGSLSAFNPEIGVLADIVGQLSESSADGEGNDKLSARELELVFGHPVDPYSRLDATVSFSDFEAANLEEAYLTHWGLPAELKARVGRFKPKIGKTIPIHRDSLDTVDEPRVIESYFGVEGMSRTGVDVSGFFPMPWEAVTHELTAGVLEGGVGEGGTLFGATRRRPSFYAHLKNFWDTTETSNVELGATYLTGSKDADRSFEVHALGFDATLVHHFTPTNKLKWQNEVFLQSRDESVTFNEDGTETRVEEHPWGLYSLLDYRLSPRFGIGWRFDYVRPIDLDLVAAPRNADTAWSGYLTLYQSEFARWRLQYKHTSFARGGDDNALFLQGTFAIGVHKHQLQ